MRLDQVWLRYGVRAPWVLRAVELEIGPGQSAVVLGRNGVGKSTLLQVAVGVLDPTRGVVRDRPSAVGWVPERFPADQPYTVDQYLTGMGRIRGLSAAAAARTVTGWIERLGLAAYRDVRLPALSKGTAQKVGLAQALLRPPGLLVLDEPWEGLDAATRELVPELIGEVLDDGGAVLVSDHRGETVRLPHAAQWSVADGTVSVLSPGSGGQRPAGAETPAGTASAVPPTPAGGVSAVSPAGADQRAAGAGTSVVEIAVPTERALETVAALRRAGHQVLGVRRAEPPAAGHADLAAEVPAPHRTPAARGTRTVPGAQAVPAVPGVPAVPAIPAKAAGAAGAVDGGGEQPTKPGAATGEAS
ncbi:ATP-binding cassette domain-containing protein [Plantactinospora sp. KLBMP9567]|uniref:ATP-binding cassette domain-containing protein n=1 Tax=Plantactinospora sp. KLBMP9567 TaxID=3085900 RepID=UPI002981F7E1|nr:ATP-binding cassette domain-containing protein [Plantactinospora sp. KLBMP9567]MDW5324650.1 ATP-binding cassette domain-containing protein [Plantactinospora sp. KLBMP9567]